MNKQDMKPNYKKIYLFVKEKFDKTNHFYHGPFDETYFTMRVFEETKNIIKELKNKELKKQELLTASILHDVGKTKIKYVYVKEKNKKITYEEAEGNHYYYDKKDFEDAFKKTGAKIIKWYSSFNDKTGKYENYNEKTSGMITALFK